MKTFILALLLYASAVQAQDSTTVNVEMPCGVAGTPACIFEPVTTDLGPSSLTVEDASTTFNSSLISIAGHEISFAFPFQKTSCSQPAETADFVNGPSVSLSVDYCKVANVYNDVASILAYVLTAGYLINLAFKPRGE
jgi:hypothetical protein